MRDQALIDRLSETARQLRLDVVKMLHQAGSGHTGGSLSAADIMAALFFEHMNLNPQDPERSGRDWFVLSKGHAAPIYYAALAQRGLLDPAETAKLRRTGCALQGHPDCKLTPGVDVSTGSLGQGLSVALGMALGARLDFPQARVFVLLGDGELQEGQIWEAAMAAAHYRTANLTAVVDNNGLQIDGPVSQVMSIEPLADKWRAFGWAVREIDGHDLTQILDGLAWADAVSDRPAVLVAKTIKGKGVSIFEGQVKYHGVSPTDEEFETCLLELEAGREC
ncbi:MAG: transketolase [Deltaproteobacteria bacterium]|nr:transketolase [Deltaproteobacteria bacterium]